MAARPRPSTEQLAAYALAALDNAKGLYDSAVLLRDHAHYASAFTVAGLAADEVGKHILITAFPSRPQTNEEWSKFWKRLGLHREKLGNVEVSLWVAEYGDLRPPPTAEELHRQRMAATYVDIDDIGRVTAPSDVITKDDVERLLAKLERELAYCQQQVGRLSPEELARWMETAGDSPVVKAYDELQQIDPRAGPALLSGLRWGLPLDAAKQAATEVVRVLQTETPDET